MNKLYICHKAKSENGQPCHYATIYDEHYKIPLISAKKYTSEPSKTSERSDWNFNGGLKKIGKTKEEKKVWPTEGCGKVIYAENDEQTPTVREIDRGHLFANALGVNEKEAMATFSLYNVAPQFAHTNRGHWKNQVEAHAKNEITSCFNDKSPIQETAFYLVAGTRDYKTLDYSCVDCTVDWVWNFDRRKEADRHRTTEKCCKVTLPNSNSPLLAFPKTMWMAGCCCYKEITKDPVNGEETLVVPSKFNIATFYGNSSSLNKEQAQKVDPPFVKGFDFEKRDIDGNVNPFRNTICGGEAPKANLKHGRSDSNNDRGPPAKAPAPAPASEEEDCELSEVSGDQNQIKLSKEQSRKKREVDQCSSCESCQTGPILVSKQSLKIVILYIKSTLTSLLNNTKFIFAGLSISLKERVPTFGLHCFLFYFNVFVLKG